VIEKMSETPGLIFFSRASAWTRVITGTLAPDLEISTIWRWSSANLSNDVAVISEMVFYSEILS
jgi:hypothetical protein